MDCYLSGREFRAAVLAFGVLAAAVAMTCAAESPLVAPSNPTAASAPVADRSVAAMAVTRAMRNDAALNDIYFTSPQLGWAVGDRGVIWHTADGGTTWREQQSNTVCNLGGIYMLDDHRGWCVGGECQQGRAATRGIILRTDDGGATWTQSPRVLLPSLAGVKFFDHDHGIAYGQSSSAAPSGAFSTHDGGNTWQPLTTDQSGGWLAGDFLAPDAGAVAGQAGRLATMQRHQLISSPLATSSLRSFRAMRLVAPTTGWAAGDGGLLMTTHDLGRSWQTPPTELPQSTSNQFDFRAIAVQGSHVWVAGSPGTRIFHSPDSGQTWDAATTSQTVPIRALWFADANHGWASGELGSILSTSDGGHTWTVQRSGAKRAALLAIFSSPTDVPLELLAESGAADGYVAAVDILSSAEAPSDFAPQTAPQRSAESLLQAGAASTANAWRFPLPAADLALAPADLLQALNRENDGQALEQLKNHLVRDLRTWRPDVVVTYHAAANAGSSMDALIEQLVLHAVETAADPTQRSEIANDAGLPPWQVKKIYGLLQNGERGDELLASARFSPWLGTALGDYVSPARCLLEPTHSTPPETYELKLLFNAAPGSENARGIFGGLSLAPGSDARRPQLEMPTQDLDALREQATRRRHFQELFSRTETNAAWAGQVSSMIDGLNPDDAGEVLVQLADGYRKAGRLDLAADTYFMLARRFPDHRFVDQSLDWLIHFYASSEMAQRMRSRAGAHANTTTSEPQDGVRQVSALTTLEPGASSTGGLSREDRFHRAVQLADYLKSAHPALYAEPGIRFSEIAAQRQLGFANPAERFFISLHELPASNPWRECAATEEWLAKPADAPPAKKLTSCRVTDQPPQLDGKLDEPFWASADRLRLTTAVTKTKGPSNDDVRLARDDRFLYIGIHCLKSPNVDYAPDASPRAHDADLSQHDRVTLRLDTDRDYSTAFELTVDSRGWTQDACCGDAMWNPTWYVAAASDDTSWTIEAAIPLVELVDHSPAARDVWAVAAQRIIPRVGYQSWAGVPASANTPDQYGLLIFQ